MSCHISDSFSFQVFRAFSKFCTTQLSDIRPPPFLKSAYGASRKADLPRKLCLVSLGYLVSACDKGQNLFRKGNDDAARKGQKAVCPLGRVVRFQRQTNLHHAETEQNHTNCTD